MSKTYYVKDLEPGNLFVDFFAVRKKNLIEYEDKTRLELELGDKTGRIQAIVWHNAENIYTLFDTEDIIKIKGKVTVYGNRLQIVVKKIRKAKSDEYDVSDYLPATEKNIDDLLQQMNEYIVDIRNEYLKKLIENIFTEKFTEEFSNAPAGKLWHHRYIGGLLEHTIAVMTICNHLADIYSDCTNKDLLISGALLHDIGKVHEFKANNFFDYSDEGRLIGHVAISHKIVANAIDAIPEFPDQLAMKLKHLILSHHGEKASGAPVVPQIPEAFILHYADQIDSTMGALNRIIDNEKTDETDWSNYVNLLDRFIYFR